jgi:alanine racemase
MRPSWVEVDLDAIRTNVAGFVAFVAPAELWAVVKADGYGHGDVPVAMAAAESGASGLCVALVEEGIRLREAGLDLPILLLSEPDPEDAAEVLAWRLTPTVYRHATLEVLRAAGEVVTGIAIKVDTGMHRVGASSDQAVELARRAVQLGVTIDSVWTHFAVAETDDPFTEEQTRRFDQACRAIEAAGVAGFRRHLSNTAGTLLHPGSRGDLVRVGLGLYGLLPSPPCAELIEVTPAMRVVSHISYLQRLPAGSRPSYGRRRPLTIESTVATVPIGYADGVPRLLSNRNGEVLIGGRRFPLAGTVTMDQILVDIGDADVRVGDEVVLLGTQGGSEIPADEWAEKTDTISYEIVCGIGPRLPRRYVGGEMGRP